MQPASFLLALATSAIATNAPADGRSPGNGKAPQAATDLSQCDFSRRKLAGKNLCGVFLAGATLRHTVFNGAQLEAANFAADVWNANLTNALNTGDPLHEALAEPFVAKQR